jgi:Asp-tRNA(Asn)/Glu-tRNA(Gln) amidotransferase C subunit
MSPGSRRPRDEALANAPDQRDGMFRVKPVFDLES